MLCGKALDVILSIIDLRTLTPLAGATEVPRVKKNALIDYMYTESVLHALLQVRMLHVNIIVHNRVLAGD